MNEKFAVDFGNDPSNDKKTFSGAVVLPCTPDQFSSFIADLLGKPQELTRSVSGQFIIDKSEVTQLHNLITQRVWQQHASKPLQFTARIRFNNGTTILINDFEDFQSYHEVRSVTSNGLDLSWTFLLQLPDHQSPQKQEIEFSFIAENGNGNVSYRILHTARTWGADIEALFAHYIDSLMKEEKPIRKLLRTNSVQIGFSFSAVMAAVMLGGLGYVNSSTATIQNEILREVLGAAVPANVKIDQIIQFLVTGDDTLRSMLNVLFLLLSILGSVATGIWIGILADSHPPSDIILTKRAEELHAIRKQKYERSLLKLVIATLGTITLGIAVNFIYDYVVKTSIERTIVKQTTEAAKKAP